jgi:carbamate kinase
LSGLKSEVIVIALGGNALLREGELGTFEEQSRHVQGVAKQIVDLIERGFRIVLTHGNGPQVGATLMRHRLANGIFPALPLHACNAETQGLIGYMIEQVLQDEINRRNIQMHVTTVITRVIVDENDPAFQNPSKPVGKIFHEWEEQEWMDTLSKDDSRIMIKKVRSGNGYRLAVPSPKPLLIVEHRVIENLIKANFLVIACGGGGIPIINKNNITVGVNAVIDKDLASELLATLIGASRLVLLTNVDGVYEQYGKATQKLIMKIMVDELDKLGANWLGEGSMAPKVKASTSFIKNGGKEAIIAHLDKLTDAVAGHSGTHVIPGAIT